MEAPGFGLLVGLEARSFEVVAVPFTRVAMASGLKVSAGFQTADAGFNGAIIAREAGRREQKCDVVLLEQCFEGGAGKGFGIVVVVGDEGGIEGIVGFQDQRRCVLSEEQRRERR